jgi:hypothetical protein
MPAAGLLDLIAAPHDICSCTMQWHSSINVELYYFNDITRVPSVAHKQAITILLYNEAAW